MLGKSSKIAFFQNRLRLMPGPNNASKYKNIGLPNYDYLFWRYRARWSELPVLSLECEKLSRSTLK